MNNAPRTPVKNTTPMKPQDNNTTQILTNAKLHLADLGLSYRVAAPMVGVTYQHLSDVLNGHRRSLPLLVRVMALGKNRKRRTTRGREQAATLS
jgi:hypothetical protein